MTTITKENVKSKAKNLKEVLKSLGHEIALTHCYELLARTNGYRNWNDLYHKLESVPTRDLITPDLANGVEPVKTVMGCAKVLGDPKNSNLKLFIVQARNDCGETELVLDIAVYAESELQAFNVVEKYLEDSWNHRELWRCVYMTDDHSKITSIRSPDNGKRVDASAGSHLSLYKGKAILEGKNIWEALTAWLKYSDKTIPKYLKDLSENSSLEISGNSILEKAVSQFYKEVLGESNFPKEKLSDLSSEYHVAFKEALSYHSKGNYNR